MNFAMVVTVLLSIALLFVHIGAQAFLAVREFGLQWNFSPRDGNSKPHCVMSGRAARASANYRETWPAFLALAFLVAAYGGDIALGLIGAWIWLVARLVYIPLYLGGVVYVRSAVWFVALVGLAVMAVALL